MTDVKEELAGFKLLGFKKIGFKFVVELNPDDFAKYRLTVQKSTGLACYPAYFFVLSVKDNKFDIQVDDKKRASNMSRGSKAIYVEVPHLLWYKNTKCSFVEQSLRDLTGGKIHISDTASKIILTKITQYLLNGDDKCMINAYEGVKIYTRIVFIKQKPSTYS